jgi:hypothetical protein
MIFAVAVFYSGSQDEIFFANPGAGGLFRTAHFHRVADQVPDDSWRCVSPETIPTACAVGGYDRLMVPIF